MESTARDLIEFVNENNIMFIRLGFCDMFGISKNMAIMASQLPSVLDGGAVIDGSAVSGYQSPGMSDLLLCPDTSTPVILPWRPGPGRVMRLYCDIKNPDGSPFVLDNRTLLKKVVQRASKMGYACKIGAECEFTLFKTDDDGKPVDEPYDSGGYLDVAPLDRGEDIRREICLTLDEMGITPECSHHERGPGQNEVDFTFSEALYCADNFITFKNVVKTIASRHGLYASFMPKPLKMSAGNGLHINLSLSENDTNIFKSAEDGHSPAAESFIAGILSKIAELTVFLNPITNSYSRLGTFEAPKYITWSHQNRSALIRIPAAKGEKVRMELRSPDPAINPYLTFALLLSAGLDGIEQDMALPDAVNEDLSAAGAGAAGAGAAGAANNLAALPDSLADAITAAEASSFIKSVIGSEFLTKYLSVKKTEAAGYAEAKDKENFDKLHYFSVI